MESCKAVQSFTLHESDRFSLEGKKGSERLSITGSGMSFTVRARFVSKCNPLEKARHAVRSIFTKWVKTSGFVPGRGRLYVRREDLENCPDIKRLRASLKQADPRGTLFDDQARLALEVEVGRECINGRQKFEIRHKRLPHGGWCSANGLYLRTPLMLGEGTAKEVTGAVWISSKDVNTTDVAISKIKFCKDPASNNFLCWQTRIEDDIAAEVNSPYVVGKADDVFYSEDKKRLFMASKRYFTIGNVQIAERKLGRPLTWHEKVKIALDVARGVQAIHEAGYIHRDIKDDNVFIEYNAEDISAVVGDLGLAVHKDDVERNRCQGTDIFAPPEVRPSGVWTQEGDLYSLGAYFNALFAPSSVEAYSNETGEWKPSTNWRAATSGQTGVKALITTLLGEAGSRPNIDSIISTLKRDVL